MSKQPPPAPIASAIGPCPTILQIRRTPRHWKFTQHLRTTRPSPDNSKLPWTSTTITTTTTIVLTRTVHIPFRTSYFIVICLVFIRQQFCMAHLLYICESRGCKYHSHNFGHVSFSNWLVGWLVGCFGFNDPLRQYFSLYRAVSQREGEREEKEHMRVKMSKQPPPAPTASALGPCPTVIQIVGRPGTGSLPSTIAPPDHPLIQ